MKSAASRARPDAGPSIVAHHLARFFDNYFSSRPRILVACSGGPDSVALVHGLAELAQKRPITVEIGHVNHRLRGRESNADQRFVEGLGRRFGWPVHVVARPIPTKGNLEENARELRYAALGQMARRRRLQAVLTAHTMNDQAETVLMNLIRGSGPEGLAGMRPVRQDPVNRVLLVRPFLDLDRKDVRAYVASRGQFREDRTNKDDRFLRNYVRLRLFDYLSKRAPGFERRIANLADLMREELPLMESLIEGAMTRVGRPYNGGWLLDRAKLEAEPLAVQRRVLRQAVGRDLLTFAGVERLRSWMVMPPGNGRMWQLRKGWVVERLSKSGGSPSPALFWFRRVPSTRNKSKIQLVASKKGR